MARRAATPGVSDHEAPDGIIRVQHNYMLSGFFPIRVRFSKVFFIHFQ
jgi:hypothetical protein